MRGKRGGALIALAAGLVAFALLSGGSGASAAPDGGGFNLAQVTTIAPDDTIYVTAPSGDGTRLFIVGQQGRIRLFKNGALLPTPFLDIDPLVTCCGERGLLSMAFAPDYVTSGLFYVYYTRDPRTWGDHDRRVPALGRESRHRRSDLAPQRPGDPSLRAGITTAASCSSGPTATSTSPRGTGAERTIPTGRGRT